MLDYVGNTGTYHKTVRKPLKSVRKAGEGKARRGKLGLGPYVAWGRVGCQGEWAEGCQCGW